jgi:hypothetical protein
MGEQATAREPSATPSPGATRSQNASGVADWQEDRATPIEFPVEGDASRAMAGSRARAPPLRLPPLVAGLLLPCAPNWNPGKHASPVRPDLPCERHAAFST